MIEVDWEHLPQPALSTETLNAMVAQAFPKHRRARLTRIDNGLANSSYRITLDGTADMFVLRVHTRDPLSVTREAAIAKRLQGSGVPMPELLHVQPKAETQPYAFSVWRYVPGELLAQVMARGDADVSTKAARACGALLARLSEIKFTQCGEFDAQLGIARPYGEPSVFIPQALHHGLTAGLAGVRIGPALRERLLRAIERHAPLLRALDHQAVLVHGDFKRFNLLMSPDMAVSALLDWEFSFAGPTLIDVGNFLRGGPELPAGFAQAFAESFKDAGGVLPDAWPRLARLVDLLAQVHFLNNPMDRPRVIGETLGVVQETVRQLEAA